ncbi:MAG: tetratricopeptide repeat protein [Bacteroidales bacterium]
MQGGRFSFLLFAFISLVFISNIAHADKFKSVDEILAQTDSIALTSKDSAVIFLINRIDQQEYTNSELFQLYSKAGELNFENQFFEVSENYFNLSLEFVDKLDNEEGYVNTILDLGRIQRRLGNYEKALQYDMEALSIIENSDDKKKRALVYNYIGIDHYRFRNFNEAILYFTQSMKLREEISDSIGIADCYNNLGMIYDDEGDKEKALESYEMAYDIYERLNEADGQAATYNNVAGIFYQKNDLTKVMEYMLKSLEIRKKDGDIRKLSFTYLNIASVYFMMGDIDQSITFNLEGLKLASQIQAKSQLRRAYQSLSEAYAKLGKFEQAFDYHVLFARVNDSIFEENKVRSMAEMQIKYESAKKEIENQLLKSENEIKSRNQVWLSIIAFVLVALLLVLIYFFRLRNKSLKQEKSLAEIEKTRNEQQKQHLQDKVFAEKQINQLQKDKFNTDLKHTNHQLANSTLSLINKNEVLGEIRSKLNLLAEKGIEVSEINSYINQNLDMDTDWKKFKFEFDEAHPQFFERLHNSYPDLTETYLKICAYIRIDLTSREIADLLNVSQSAINKNRQRLRKMLALEAEADLNEFLKQF